MTIITTPYANLDPSLILDAVEQLGFHCSGSLFALNSYENRVYQIGLEDGAPLIAKFYRPGRWSDEAILEEHQFSTELAAHEIPVVAPIKLDTTLFSHQGFRFALFPRQGGRALELDNLEQLEWMGRFIGRLHAVGACQPFQHRMVLDVTTYGTQPNQFLLENNFIPPEIIQNYSDIVAYALEEIQRIFSQVEELRYIRLHGDCHTGNILWNQSGPQIVDLDDCLMGPAVQDIWMLLSGANPQEERIQLDCILNGYEEFYTFNYGELKLINALRTLRMLHYSAWLAKRWEDPAFPLNFPWFNTAKYWQEHLQNLREQIALLGESND